MDLDRIGKGIDRSAESGGQEGLLISDKAALVVDVTRRTVIMRRPDKKLGTTCSLKSTV